MAFLGQNPRLPRIKARLTGDVASAVKQAAPSEKLKGEIKPLETGRFYTVRQMVLKQGEDGIIEAHPLSLRPGLLEAETANAYYLTPTWDGEKPPAAGDFIEVELRPEFGGMQ